MIDLNTVLFCLVMLVFASGFCALVVFAIFIARKEGWDDESDRPVDEE